MVKLDQGGEYYYRWCTKDGCALSPFVSFLEENGIIAQHIKLGSPDQNSVT